MTLQTYSRLMRTACCFLAAACLVSHGATAEAVVRLANNVEAPSSGDMIVSISVHDVASLESAEFRIGYDPRLLHPEAVYSRGAAQDAAVQLDTRVPGEVNVSLRGSVQGRAEGVTALADVRFKVAGPAGTVSDLVWLGASINDTPTLSDSTSTQIVVQGTGASVAIPDNGRVAPGGTAWVPVSVTDLAGAGSVQIGMRFDPSRIEPVDVQTAALTRAMTVSGVRIDNGDLQFSLGGSGSASGGGTLAYVAFKSLGSAGASTPIDLYHARIDGEARSASLDDGVLTICDPRDADNDGFGGCSGDCNDADGLIRPNAGEVCDGSDNNCDGVADNDIPRPSGSSILTLARQGRTAHLEWSEAHGALSYEVVRGSLGKRAGASTGSLFADATCLDAEVSARTATDPGAPATGGVWYLVKPVSCGGSGDYDSGGAAQSQPRIISVDSDTCTRTKKGDDS